MLALLYVVMFYAFLAAVAAWAWVRGGVLERRVAVLYVAATAVSVVLLSGSSSSWGRLEYGVLSVDCCVAAGLLVPALRTGEGWLIASAALQLVATTAHFARWAGAGMTRLACAILEGGSSYPLVLILAWAVWRTGRPARDGSSRPS